MASVIFGSTEAQEVLEKDKARGYLAITPDAELIDCPDCKGEGDYEIECSECGGCYRDECATCDGEGKLTKNKFLELDAQRNCKNARTELEKLSV